MDKQTEYYKQIEVACRRKMPEAMHPDACPKLRLHGVDFAIPPRGLRVVPKFDADGKATLDVSGGDDWPEVPALLERLVESLGEDNNIAAEVLCELMTLGRRALLAQYDLTDEQVAELLAFDSDEGPAWVNSLIRWARGALTDADVLAEAVAEAEGVSNNGA